MHAVPKPGSDLVTMRTIAAAYRRERQAGRLDEPARGSAALRQTGAPSEPIGIFLSDPSDDLGRGCARPPTLKVRVPSSERLYDRLACRLARTSGAALAAIGCGLGAHGLEMVSQLVQEVRAAMVAPSRRGEYRDKPNPAEAGPRGMVPLNVLIARAAGAVTPLPRAALGLPLIRRQAPW